MKKHLKNKEMEIILCCAGPKLENNQTERLRNLAKDIIDWQPVIDLAMEHGLINFLYYHLQNSCKKFLPEDVINTLKSYYFNNSTRNMALSVSLVNLLNLFKKNNIDTVPFKGSVQAQLLYNDIGLRSFSDLDILVKKKDAIKARDLLFTNGFVTDVEIPDPQIKTYLKKENFFHLVNTSGTINIDLHWELTGRYSLQPIYFEDLADRLDQMEFFGHSIFILSMEDTLIQLCIHGTSHCWKKLEMICAIAEIIKSKKIKTWDKVIEKGSLLKCRKMIFVGLMLAEQLFVAGLPDDLKNRIDADKDIQKFIKKVTDKIMNQTQALTESLSWRFSPMHFTIRDNLMDKARYAARLIFQPTIREWDKFPLPDSLLFLYYFLRPYRLITEGLKKQNA